MTHLAGTSCSLSPPIAVTKLLVALTAVRLRERAEFFITLESTVENLSNNLQKSPNKESPLP